MKKQFVTSTFVAMMTTLAVAQAFIPKYGPEASPKATLLKKERTFIQTKPAPDFWAFMPYYEGMKSAHSASVVSATMVVK